MGMMSRRAHEAIVREIREQNRILRAELLDAKKKIERLTTAILHLKEQGQVLDANTLPGPEGLWKGGSYSMEEVEEEMYGGVAFVDVPHDDPDDPPYDEDHEPLDEAALDAKLRERLSKERRLDHLPPG